MGVTPVLVLRRFIRPQAATRRWHLSLRLLTVLLMTWLGSQKVSADELVLRDGTLVCTAKPYTVKGKSAVFTLCDGRFVSQPLAEIDPERTAKIQADPEHFPVEPKAHVIGYPPLPPSYEPKNDPDFAAFYGPGRGAPAGAAGEASGPKTVQVRGYMRKDGTVVRGFSRAAPGFGSGRSSGHSGKR
jgi:hypothetical protein